jgi:hypothetical protein
MTGLRRGWEWRGTGHVGRGTGGDAAPAGGAWLPARGWEAGRPTALARVRHVGGWHRPDGSIPALILLAADPIRPQVWYRSLDA